MPSNDGPLARSGDASERNFAARPPGATALSCEKPTTWIDLKLEDEAGRPMANQRYRMVLADGRVVEGTTDADGLAGLDGIDPGECELSFPDLEQSRTSLKS